MLLALTATKTVSFIFWGPRMSDHCDNSIYSFDDISIWIKVINRSSIHKAIPLACIAKIVECQRIKPKPGS